MAVSDIWALVVAALAWHAWRLRVQIRRQAFIESYRWPKGLLAKLMAKHPTLSQRDVELVAQGLRQFFRVYLAGGRRNLAMPSQVADDLWHEFILYTKAYGAFCQRAFGGFFHHTPAAVLGASRSINTDLRRCWWWACKDESIHPAKPSRLPLLFALDAKFHIANGFHYVPDCSGPRRSDGTGISHCGGDFSNAAVDGGTDGFGDHGPSGDTSDGGGSGCSGSDGGGCGGGGGD
jgi:hypothetical protein